MTMPRPEPREAMPAAVRRGVALLPFVIFLLSLPVAPALADAAPGTHVTLTAQADELLPNDEVVVRFRIEAQGPQAEALRNQVNHISRVVSARLGREKDVVLTTLGRRMEPVWHYDSVSHRQVQDGWRLVQDEQAISSEPVAVPGWVDAIEQDGAHLDGLHFQASQHTIEAARERLRGQAIAAFRRRAAATAKALDAISFQILNLNTASTLPAPRPVQLMATLAKAAPVAAPPALDAGESRITVTVSGEILLPTKKYPVK